MKYIFCTDTTGHQRHTRPDGQCFLSAELPQIMRDGLEQTAHTLSQAERRHSLPGILLIMQYICLVIGMVCGGDVTAHFQFIPAEDPLWNDTASRALALLEQHTAAEAARLCGRPQKTVEAQVYRAKKILAAQLSAAGKEGI